jgi:hypothetical protein
MIEESSEVVSQPGWELNWEFKPAKVRQVLLLATVELIKQRGVNKLGAFKKHQHIYYTCGHSSSLAATMHASMSHVHTLDSAVAAIMQQQQLLLRSSPPRRGPLVGYHTVVTLVPIAMTSNR